MTKKESEMTAAAGKIEAGKVFASHFRAHGNQISHAHLTNPDALIRGILAADFEAAGLGIDEISALLDGVEF